MLQYYVVSVRD